MATPAGYANELIAATFEESSGDLWDQVYDTTPVLDFLRQYQQPASGGEKLTTKLLYGQSKRAGFFATGDSLNLGQNAILDRAQFEWKNIGTSCLIYDQDVMRQGGDAKIMDIAQEKLDEAKMDLADTLSDALCASSWDTSKIESLIAITDQSTVIGNIDPATYVWWKAQMTNGSNGAISVAVMETMFNSCGKGKGGVLPSHLFASTNMIESYKKLAGTLGKVTMDGSGASRRADLGFEEVSYRGRPMLMEPNLADGTILFLNKDVIKLRPHSRNAKSWITQVSPIQATPGATAHLFWGMLGLIVRRRASLGRLYGYAAA